MLFSYAIDLELFSNREEVDNLKTIFYDKLFQQCVLCTDNKDSLKKKHIEIEQMDPVFATNVQDILSPENNLEIDIPLKKKICLNSEYGGSIFNFISNSVDKNILIDFIIISEKNKKNYDKNFYIKNNIEVLTVKEFYKSKVYSSIRKVENESINFSKIEANKLINFFKYSSNVSLFLYDFGKNKTLNKLSHLVHDTHLRNFKLKYPEDERLFKLDNKIEFEKVYQNYSNKIGTTWAYNNPDHMVTKQKMGIYNVVDVDRGDEFLKYILTIEYFRNLYLKALKLNFILEEFCELSIYLNEPKKLVTDERPNLKKFINEYFTSINKNEKIQIKIYYIQSDDSKLATDFVRDKVHARYIVTNQGAIKLNFSSIYVFNDKTYNKKITYAEWKSQGYRIHNTDDNHLISGFPQSRIFDGKTQIEKFFQKISNLKRISI